MAEPAADDLATRVRNALRDASTPLWLPVLTTELADTAWRKLGRDLGLSRSSYGTARLLRRDPRAARRVVATLGAPPLDGAECDGLPIELLPEDLARRCAGSEVRYFQGEEVSGAIAGCVTEALGVLGAVPTVLPTVCTLIRALHLFDPQDDEVDVSFSDPALPFSAFVSVPGSGATAGSLRVAEAILHEAMHLQLTLVEAIVPLVNSSEATFFSPWRNEHRTAQGVFHALYVFRVIDTFLATAQVGGAALQSHAAERRATIARQVGEIHDFRRCVDLTADGAAFVGRLLDRTPL